MIFLFVCLLCYLVTVIFYTFYFHLIVLHAENVRGLISVVNLMLLTLRILPLSCKDVITLYMYDIFEITCSEVYDRAFYL